MLFDPATNTAFGNLGWVDHGALWCWDVATARERRIAIPDARYVSVRHHAEGLLRLIHHGEGAVASVRACAAPEVELAGLFRDHGGWRFRGDSSLWGDPLALLMMSDSGLTELLLVDGHAGTTRMLDLSWYNDESYDRGYQGLVDCLALPGDGLVAVSVQRSSELIIIDPDRNAAVASIPLAGSAGNPALRLWSDTEFLASDYDSLCLVDRVTLTARCSEVLQPAAPPNTRQFTGDYDVRGSTCVIARPFSGDVLRLRVEDFSVTGRAAVPGQPLSVCMTSDRSFLTRDWQTGKVEVGEFD